MDVFALERVIGGTKGGGDVLAGAASWPMGNEVTVVVLHTSLCVFFFGEYMGFRVCFWGSMAT